MAFDVFLTFDGDCRAALAFYAGVFKQKMPEQIMTYGQNPGGSSDAAANADRERVLYACMPIHGCRMMFSDCPSGFKSVKGNNIMLTVGLEDDGEIKETFDKLAEGGVIEMKLGKTFFSELFGMVTDKFGIIWQISKIAAN
jgi:PhnB protein